MVVHVIDNLSPASGGPTTAVLELARHQAAAGEAVAVVCRSVDPSDARPARWRSLPVELLRVSGAGGARPLARIIRAGAPRIVHLHGIWDSVVRHAARAASRTGTPWVISSHGMLHPRALERGWMKKHAYLGLFRQPLRGASAVIVLNAEEAEHARTEIGARCVQVVTPGIDPSQYRSGATDAFRQSLPQLGDRPYLLFLGRLDPIKGLDRLLAAFAHACALGARCDLVIAGPDHGAGDAVRARANALGLSRSVHFPGSLQGEEKTDALAGCTAYVHRPRYEGFGISVAEAMASGRPVITTRECHIDGAAAAGAIEVVADTDETFGAAIASILNSPERAAALGDRARRWAHEALAWPRIIERTESVYRASRTGGLLAGAIREENQHYVERAHGSA